MARLLLEQALPTARMVFRQACSGGPESDWAIPFFSGNQLLHCFLQGGRDFRARNSPRAHQACPEWT
jgi:hypothetical protein